MSRLAEILSTARSRSGPTARPTTGPDRPGWIPEHIEEGWDPDPYAYQTEEEQMPAGGLHGQLLTYITEVLRAHLKDQGQMLLVDAFLLYRDANAIKQRIGPDLLLMEDAYPAPAAYDLDLRAPPRCIVEITSPDSHIKDLKANVALYLGLGVHHYLVIDAVTPSARLRDPFELHLWRSSGGATPAKVPPDPSGRFHLPEMNLLLGTGGQRLVFFDATTGSTLADNDDLRKALQAEQRAAAVTRQAEAAQALRAEAEARRAEAAEEEAKRAYAAGEQEQALSIARKMLADGLAMTVVANYTGLSLATLSRIRQEAK